MIVTSWLTTSMVSWIFYVTMSSVESRPIPTLCTNSGSVDLLALSLAENTAFPTGVELIKEKGVVGYRFDPEARLFGVYASEVMTKCKYFPHEFSLILTFQRKTTNNDNEYLLTLLAQDRQTILFGVRLQRDSLYLDYFGLSRTPGKNIRVQSPRLGDGKWHTVVVTVSRREVKFTVDCLAAVNIALDKPFPRRINTRGARFHIASRRRKRNRFTGLLRQVKLFPGSDASIPLCAKSQENNYFPSWLSTVQPSRASEPARVQISDDFDEEATCNDENEGQLIYTRNMGQLQMCDRDRWKRLATTTERLDYVSDYSDLVTKSKTLDVEIFRIPEEGLFLAAANQGRNKSMDSTLYKWDDAKRNFFLHQTIKTDTARDWEFFTIESEYFLAVANQGTDEATPTSTSVIFKWDRKRRKFRPFQYIQTYSARCWESFEIDGSHYLAVANFAGLEGQKQASWIFRWVPTTRTFVQYQSLETIGAYDFEYFKIGTEHYLAVANSFDGTKTNIDSVIYNWRLANFVPLHYVETHGATDWEHFEIAGRHFLVVANYYDLKPHYHTYFVDSCVYEMGPDRNQLKKVQDIATQGALDFEFFTVGRDSYLISASSSDNNNNHISTIYRWQGIEQFVPVHNVSTGPCADWESFSTKRGEHFLVSANINSRKSKVVQLQTY